MEEALRALLLNHPLVSVLVGPDSIAWLDIEQGAALPAVTLTRVSGSRDMALQGPTGLVESVVQIDCWASAYRDAKAVARAVIAVLNGHDRAPFQLIQVIGERDSFEGEGPDRLYRTGLDIRAWHDEP